MDREERIEKKILDLLLLDVSSADESQVFRHIDIWQDEGCVYFIQGVDGGSIKVGHTMDLARRFAEIQACSPSELRVLVAVPGSLKDERYFHGILKEERLHGEWFECSIGALMLVLGLQGKEWKREYDTRYYD
jgi:hypothetical protein